MIRKITEKEKPKKGLGCLLIALLIAGVIISAYLVGIGGLQEIIHP